MGKGRFVLGQDLGSETDWGPTFGFGFNIAKINVVNLVVVLPHNAGYFPNHEQLAQLWEGQLQQPLLRERSGCFQMEFFLRIEDLALSAWLFHRINRCQNVQVQSRKNCESHHLTLAECTLLAVDQRTFFPFLSFFEIQSFQHGSNSPKEMKFFHWCNSSPFP